ncbi:MAG: Zn-ribbon domain-containing OB-fold protein [Acidimicrobiia bacterium]|nr:Zn-ribbon domain-containing OB-fold protein [Acidimicrobiia bacterium]
MTEPETRHLPVPDADTQPYWDAASRGELVFMRCRACDSAYLYPRARCPRCWSTDTDWEHSAGTGTVYSYTVVHQNLAAPFRERVPYVLAVVELDEGPRLMTNLDVAPPAVRVGQRVEVRFREEAAGMRVPVFVPAV